MSTRVHEIHLYASLKTFVHALVSLLVGIVVLMVAAYATGSMEMLAQYTTELMRNVEPQIEASAFPNALLFGLLLDGLIGIAASLLVFNRIHFHRWLPKKEAAQ